MKGDWVTLSFTRPREPIKRGPLQTEQPDWIEGNFVLLLFNPTSMLFIMKQLSLTILLFAGVFISNVCFSQVVADAGNDTAFCSSNWEEASIGGNPSAKEGTEPYTYAWSAEYNYAGHIYPASIMLVDTTVANPVFTGYFHDSAVFHLTVTDSKDNIAYDSIRVRFSEYIFCLGECRHEVSLGDSVKLGHCIFGGIPPFQYSWTPEESLSDPTSETPWAKPQSSTHYTLVYTDSIGCQTTSYCEVSVIPAGIRSDYSSGDFLKIYPNPSNGIINFKFTHPQYNNSVLKIYSTSGKRVKEVLVDDSVLAIDLADLSPGIYFYNWILLEEMFESGKIVLE